MKKIYGVSRKFSFGKWEYVTYFFTNQEDAQTWLHTEEYSFRIRELMSKEEVIKLAGEDAVKYAIDYGYYSR